MSVGLVSNRNFAIFQDSRPIGTVMKDFFRKIWSVFKQSMIACWKWLERGCCCCQITVSREKVMTNEQMKEKIQGFLKDDFWVLDYIQQNYPCKAFVGIKFNRKIIKGHSDAVTRQSIDRFSEEAVAGVDHQIGDKGEVRVKVLLVERPNEAIRNLKIHEFRQTLTRRRENNYNETLGHNEQSLAEAKELLKKPISEVVSFGVNEDYILS